MGNYMDKIQPKMKKALELSGKRTTGRTLIFKGQGA
jgi:hypothetical protein